jgi:hypothetical protein
MRDDRLTLRRSGAPLQEMPLEMLSPDLNFGRTPNGQLISVGFIPEVRGPTRYLMLDGSPFACFSRIGA